MPVGPYRDNMPGAGIESRKGVRPRDVLNAVRVGPEDDERPLLMPGDGVSFPGTDRDVVVTGRRIALVKGIIPQNTIEPGVTALEDATVLVIRMRMKRQVFQWVSFKGTPRGYVALRGVGIWGYP